MVRSISEILKTISEAPVEKRVSLLRQNNTDPIKAILFYAFDSRVKWLLPEGSPPYKPLTDAHDQHGRLFLEMRRMYLFMDPKLNLSKARREQLFIELLESVDPKDAELVVAVKDKKMPYKGITAQLVNEAFPGLVKVSEPTVEVVEAKPKTKRKKKEEVSGAKA